MNTEQTLEITSPSVERTRAIAAAIGARLRGGEVFELLSDLGGGKTAFVRGLARGLGSADAVRSPSFTISNQYHADKLVLYHYDFYRLSDPGLMRQELQEVLDDKLAIVAIEWSDSVQSVLPEARIRLTISAPEENTRLLRFAYPVSLDYLVPDDLL